MKFATVAVAAMSLVLSSALTASAAVRLAVLAPAGEATALEQWTPFATALEQALGEPVTLSASAPGELLTRLEAGAVDVIVGNPVQAAIASVQMDAQPLASVVKKAGAQFAGVIIANPNSGITTATDLRGKKVMSLKPTAAGGYIFQAYHLAQLGLDVPGDFARHVEAKNQKDIVNLVAKGVFDAGFVRTGMVDGMIARGEISADDVLIVDRRETPGFPLPHTTDLYPEWMVLAHSSFDQTTAERLRDVLKGLSSDNPVMAPASLSGFSEPQDLTRLINALVAVGMLPSN